MKKLVKVSLILISLIIIGLFVLFIYDSLFRVPPLSLSSTCQEKCSISEYKQSKCVLFPSTWTEEENPCGNNGVNVGMTADCNNPPRIGGSNNCCCYK